MAKMNYGRGRQLDQIAQYGEEHIPSKREMKRAADAPSFRPSRFTPDWATDKKLLPKRPPGVFRA